ncbi:10731_t:CDS:2, partial [Racocetra persica]
AFFVMGFHIKKCASISLEVQNYLINAQNYQQQHFHDTREQQDVLSEILIISSISVSNCSSNNQVSMQLLLDINKSNQLLLKGIIEGGASFSLVDSEIYTYGKSQTSQVIFEDLKNGLIQVSLEKVNAIITN